MTISDIRHNMTLCNEENQLITHSDNDIFRRPRSIRWQLLQAAHYIIGSFCFTVGSCMYFTDVFQSHPVVLTFGGWLFTIGSFFFLFADLQDWWDYRTGYCFSYKDYPTLDVNLNSSAPSTSFDHTEIELNVYGSICGSAFYLAGSILFIPIFGNFISVGIWFFICGSTFCYLSQIWKIYRSACNNSDHKFHLSTLLKDKPTLAMDVLSIIGNICFFIGSILFLSYIDKTNFDQNRAVFFFVFGSTCFILSSFVLQYTICYSYRR